jgi:integrase
MASIKVVLRLNKKADGTYPLCLRIIKDRKTNFIYLGHDLRKEDWDTKAHRVKKSHSNSTRLNALLTKKLAEAQDKLLEMEAAKTDSSSQSIRKGMLSAKEGTFGKQAAFYLDNLKKRGKFNRYSADNPRVERFKEFMGYDPVFSEITVSVLKKYVAWLMGGRGITERTAVNHLIVIRTLYNQAIANNVAEQKNYPFGKGKITIKFPDTSKAGLSPAEIKALEDADLKNGVDHARNLFLFSFYFAGVRISDVLRMKWSDIQDGRLWYVMGKNNKGGSLKVPEKAMQIIEKYRREKPVHNLVFPDLEGLASLDDPFAVQRRIKTRVHGINDNLKLAAKAAGISKRLTCHLSRHSFAGQAGDKIDTRTLQHLFRHTSLNTTLGYMGNFTTKKADDALDAVIGQ